MSEDERLQTVFRSVFSECPSLVNDEDGLYSIPGWDSVGQLNLVMALEAEFEIEFQMDEIGKLTNVGAIRRILAVR